MRELDKALRLNLAWLREHPRLLQRAVEWDKGGRQPGRLLSGQDIAEAKAWAARQPREAPSPTTLHLEFLLASEVWDAFVASIVALVSEKHGAANGHSCKLDGMTLAEQKQRLTYDEFLAWALRQECGRYEYIDGEIVPLPSEGGNHNLAKGELYRALQDACEAAGFAGTVFTDGMQIRTRGGRRGREPDASVSATRVTDLTGQVVPDPLIVVEVVSPSSERDDTGDKLDEYFDLPSVQHYLIVRPDKRLIVHHARGPGSALVTTFITGPTLRLDPPGLTLDLARLHRVWG